MTEKKAIILRSAVHDLVPTVNQLETTLLGLGYNMADATLWGLQVNGSSKQVRQIGGPGGGSSYTHPAYTPISESLTGATVLATFTTDAIGSVTGLTTRALTLSDLGYTAPAQYWSRDAFNNYLYPATPGDQLYIPSSDGLSATEIFDSEINIYSSVLGKFGSYLNADAQAGDEFRHDSAGASYPGGPKVEGIRAIWKANSIWSSSNFGSNFILYTCAYNSTSLISRLATTNYGDIFIGDITGYDYAIIGPNTSGQFTVSTLFGRTLIGNYGLHRDSASSYLGANTTLGYLSWQGKGGGSAHAVEIFASTGSSAWSSTNMGSTLNIRTIADGSLSLVSRIRISDSGDVILNDGGVAASFRVNGDTESYLLFADGANDRIGIGASAPGTRLHVKAGSSWGQSLIKIEQADEDKGFIEFTGTSSTDQTKNISTTPGAGALVGPKYKTDAADGWEFNCMVRQTVNGSDIWFAGYTPIAAS